MTNEKNLHPTFQKILEPFENEEEETRAAIDGDFILAAKEIYQQRGFRGIFTLLDEAFPKQVELIANIILEEVGRRERIEEKNGN